AIHAGSGSRRPRAGAILLAVLAAAGGVRCSGQDQVQLLQFGGGQGAFDLGAQFDQAVFGAVANPGRPADGDTADRLKRVRAAGEDRIEQIHRVVNLSAEQRAKLRVAMEADVGRLAEEIDGIRAGYEGQKLAVNPDGTGQEKLQERMQQMQNDIAACQRMIAATFGPAALLSKVLGDTLDERQNKHYAEALASRRGGLWKALIGAALTAQDGVLGLTQGQHEAVEALLMADPPPLVLERTPRRGPGTTLPAVGLVMLRLDQLGDEKLAAVLDPRQRAVVAALARQHGEPAEVQAQLVAAGILEESP
ncbi:MAG: hypothetical protein ACK5SI_12110, partial [Planctomycetia bacterium]